MTGKSASRLENIVNIWYINSILLRVFNILWVYIFWIYCLYIVSIYCGWCTQHLCLFPVWSRPDWILTVGNPHRTPIITIVVLHLHHLTPIIVVIISFITFNTNTNTNIEAARLNDVITISIIVKIVLCIIWQISLSPGLWFILLMLNPELCHFLPQKKLEHRLGLIERVVAALLSHPLAGLWNMIISRERRLSGDRSETNWSELGGFEPIHLNPNFSRLFSTFNLPDEVLRAFESFSNFVTISWENNLIF